MMNTVGQKRAESGLQGMTKGALMGRNHDAIDQQVVRTVHGYITLQTAKHDRIGGTPSDVDIDLTNHGQLRLNQAVHIYEIYQN